MSKTARPVSSKSIPPLALAIGATVLITGCMRSGNTRAPVRPAAQDELADESPLRPMHVPFALATPEDAIVRVVTPKSSCSGTLVDEDLVLTAHHCVVRRNDAGELTNVRHGVDDLGIELGGDDLAWGRVGVKAIVTPPCGYAGGSGDVAVLILERKLVGVATMSPRLDAPPNKEADTLANEDKHKAKPVVVVDPIGFGRCALSSGGVHRRPRVGGPIETITKGTFRVRASVCPGDSGGPVLVRGTNEVVGVMSMSAMDADERTVGISVAARLDAVRSVFAQARAIADGASPAELPPISCP